MPARLALTLAGSMCWIFLGCTIQPKIPTIVDNRVETLLRNEASGILEVSEDSNKPAHYQFRLSEFPREDILGMSVGDGRIYISYKLAALALYDRAHLWLLRHTVAHEIAHEASAHAKSERVTRLNRGATAGVSGGDIGLPWYVRLVNYSTAQELEADRKGLNYWKLLGWDCQIWVRILEDFQNQGYYGDVSHPTSTRLEQAREDCPAA